MNHKEAVQGLRALADWLEQHGEKLGDGMSVGVYAWGADHAEALTAPGPWEKDYQGEMLYLVRRFGEGGATISVPVLRSKVCEKVPTGKKVTRKVPTAWEDVVEDEYTWDCKPILEAVAE